MPIHFFEENAFRGLTSLHNLILRHCEIPEMPPLKPVKRILITARLSHNRITSIPGKYFIGFLKLSTLDLSFNLLRSVSQLHPLSDTIEQLYLDSNRLADFPTNVHNSTYTVLVTLHLQKNCLTAFRKNMLNSFPSLRKLHLMENSISHVEDLRSIHRLATLTVRNFSMWNIGFSSYLVDRQLSCLNMR